MLGGRVMLSGHLLASKGDRVAMHSSVETRYPFLDEEVSGPSRMRGCSPSLEAARLREKFALRLVAQRLGAERHRLEVDQGNVPRCPFDSFFGDERGTPTFVDQLLGPAALKKTGFFDAAAVTHWRQAFRQMRQGSGKRTMIEMGLVGVLATQLWYHTFVDGSLADLPAASRPPRMVEEPAA